MHRKDVLKPVCFLQVCSVEDQISLTKNKWDIEGASRQILTHKKKKKETLHILTKYHKDVLTCFGLPGK